DEQTRRLESRIHDPRKIWKLSDMDLKSYSRWYDYSRARDAMFAASATAWAPWYVAHTDDKKPGRLNIISHLLSQVPYKPLAHREGLRAGPGRGREGLGGGEPVMDHPLELQPGGHAHVAAERDLDPRPAGGAHAGRAVVDVAVRQLGQHRRHLRHRLGLGRVD